MLPRPYLALYLRVKQTLIRNRRTQILVSALVLFLIYCTRLLPNREKGNAIPVVPANPLRLPIDPPTYEKLWAWERNLPQHNLDLPFPEGKTGRYVKFSNQAHRLGWNNIFNELWATSTASKGY
ncbi:hypothetical protein K438DRAFT_475663 [Mycena galopus ATCC 62051]|nr:hypothetical protein K438DRAFT_475663 [Mycena galopus ATCC 62051]